MVLKLDRYMQKNETRPYAYTQMRINPKWIKDLNVTPETIKIIEENIGSKNLDISCRNILSDKSPQARETKEKINKWDYIKLKSFFTAKEIINKIKGQYTQKKETRPPTCTIHQNKHKMDKGLQYINPSGKHRQ